MECGAGTSLHCNDCDVGCSVQRCDPHLHVAMCRCVFSAGGIICSTGDGLTLFGGCMAWRQQVVVQFSLFLVQWLRPASCGHAPVFCSCAFRAHPLIGPGMWPVKHEPGGGMGPGWFLWPMLHCRRLPSGPPGIWLICYVSVLTYLFDFAWHYEWVRSVQCDTVIYHNCGRNERQPVTERKPHCYQMDSCQQRLVFMHATHNSPEPAGRHWPQIVDSGWPIGLQSLAGAQAGAAPRYPFNETEQT